METFSIGPWINLSEEGKWSLAVTSFEATNSVFIITDGNNSFSISTSGYWSSTGGAETFNRLHKFMKHRSQNDLEAHVKEVQKRGLIITTEFCLPDLDTHLIKMRYLKN